MSPRRVRAPIGEPSKDAPSPRKLRSRKPPLPPRRPRPVAHSSPKKPHKAARTPIQKSSSDDLDLSGDPMLDLSDDDDEIVVDKAKATPRNSSLQLPRDPVASSTPIRNITSPDGKRGTSIGSESQSSGTIPSESGTGDNINNRSTSIDNVDIVNSSPTAREAQDDQDAFTEPVQKTKKSDMKKRRKSMSGDALKAMARTNVCDALKLAYYSSNESKDIQMALKQMKGTFNLLRSTNSTLPKKQFTRELIFRLSSMVEHNTETAERQRVFKTACKLAIVLQKDCADFEVLGAMLEFAKEYYCAENALIRQNVLTIIGFLFTASATLGRQNTNTACPSLEEEDEDEHVMALEYRRELYCILRDCVMDKVPEVRAEAVRSLSYLQDDDIPSEFVEAVQQSPKDLLFAALRDPSSDVRLAAVDLLSVTDLSDDHIAALVDTALTDKVTKVRRKAIKKVGRVPLRSLSADLRIELLCCSIGDSSDIIKDVASTSLLSGWLEQVIQAAKLKSWRRPVKRDKEEKGEKASDNTFEYGSISSAIDLLRILNCCTEIQACRMILVSIFDMQRQEMHLNDMHMPLSQYIGALVLQQENGVETKMLSARNAETLFLDRRHTAMDQFLMAFVWRTLADRVRAEPSEAEQLDCLLRLTPGMKPTCDIIMSYVQQPLRISDIADETEQCIARRLRSDTLLELLAIVRQLDRSDIAGMTAWRELLEFLLSDRTYELDKSVCDEVVKDLFANFYKEEDVAETFLCDVTSNIVHAAANSSNPGMDQTVCITHSDTGAKELDMDLSTRLLCLMIVNSALRTGRFRNISGVLIKGLIQSYVTSTYECVQSEEDVMRWESVREWCLQVNGVCALMDKETCATHTALFKELYLVESRTVQEAILCCLGDMVVAYGYPQVSEWFSAETLNDSGESVQLAPEIDTPAKIFEHFLVRNLQSPSLSVCEVVCKIILNDKDKEFVPCIALLLRIMFDLEASKCRKLKSMLSHFALGFAELCRDNQVMLIDGLLLMLRNRDEFAEEQNLWVDFERACIYVSYLSAYSILESNGNRDKDKKGSAQSYLLDKILLEMDLNPEDSLTDLYAKMCSVVNAQGFHPDELQKHLDSARAVLHTLQTIYERKKAVTMVKMLIKHAELGLKLAGMGGEIDIADQGLGEEEKENEEEDDYLDDLFPELPSPNANNPSTPQHKKKAQARRAGSAMKSNMKLSTRKVPATPAFKSKPLTATTSKREERVVVDSLLNDSVEEKAIRDREKCNVTERKRQREPLKRETKKTVRTRLFTKD